MSFIVAINKTYKSYFDSELKLKINPKKKPNKIHLTYAEIESRFKKEQEERKAYYARDIMSDKVWAIDQDANSDEALKKMIHYKIHHLAVEDQGALVGVITDRDIFKNKLSDELEPIHKIMNPHVLLCYEDTLIMQVAKVMLEENISSMIVIDSSKQRTGIITRTNLLSFIVRYLSQDWRA